MSVMHQSHSCTGLTALSHLLVQTAAVPYLGTATKAQSRNDKAETRVDALTQTQTTGSDCSQQPCAQLTRSLSAAAASACWSCALKHRMVAVPS